MKMVEFKTQRLDEHTVLVELRGKFTEHFHPEEIFKAVGKARVLLHLGGIRHVSSLGVREFERLLDGLNDVTLIEISPAVASHLVLLPSLGQRARVVSADLPYACRACGAERTAVVPFQREAAMRQAPMCSCGHQMFLDALPEQLLPTP